MWLLDHREGWAPKNWCFWIVVLETTLESPLDCKEIKPVNPKENQSRIFVGRTDAEAPILWPPDTKSRLIGKDPDAGKDWRQKEEGQQRMSWWDSITNPMDMIWENSGRYWRIICFSVQQSMSHKETWFSDWTARASILLMTPKSSCQVLVHVI